MAWNQGRTRIAAGALILALIAAAVVVKMEFFPSVKEDDFALSERNLRGVASGLVLVRPTHFARSHFDGVVTTTVRSFGKPVGRIIGRNVSFKDLIAAAYGQNAARVVLPPDAPKTNFDFLVTVRYRGRQRWQEEIRKQLGFVAGMEPHETDVLALKVENARLPGLTVSDSDNKDNADLHDGRLYFTHVQLVSVIQILDQVLATPAVDQTGLTNHYDFSVPWDAETLQKLQNRSTSRAVVDRILSDLGLALKPGTTTVEMLLVKRVDSPKFR